VYRLLINRGAQTYLPQMRLKCGVHSDTNQMQMPLMCFRADQIGALARAVTDNTQELFHAGAVSPKGFDDA
jgi:hypothetical protein